jgi:hypothetical protein
MGSYWSLIIDGYEILEGKNFISDLILQLFRKNDLRRKLSKRTPATYCRYEYLCSARELADRLDLMGFTMQRTVADFERGRDREVESYESLHDATVSDSASSKEITFLKRYGYKKWRRAMGKIMTSNVVKFSDYSQRWRGTREHILSFDNDNAIYGFYASDPRYYVRGCLDAVHQAGKVSLNLLDLVEGGYYEPQDDDPLASVEASSVEYSRSTPVVILTEGSSDRFILEATLPLAYPHLRGFFSFMDFEVSRAPGGAPQLVATVKAFVGSGIRNRILAVFDNDTAAGSALRALQAVDLPPNVAVMTLPHLESAKNYPTLGPQGTLDADVNGLACSVEMFLGAKVLGYGRQRLPVRWTGYDSALKQYQGELLDKIEAVKRFRSLLPKLTSRQFLRDAAWRDLRHLWTAIKEQAEALTLRGTQTENI